MLNTLELYAAIAAIILLIIGGLSAGLYFSVEANKKQAEVTAQLQQTVLAYKSTVETLQADAVQTKARQDALDAQLNDIRVHAEADKNKIVIPAKVLHDKDSAALAKIINAQTKASLDRFKVLTQRDKQ